jgi:hypothetical protein
MIFVIDRFPNRQYFQNVIKGFLIILQGLINQADIVIGSCGIGMILLQNFFPYLKTL